ncbi:hypothetical protein DPM33_15170 [Mesorhizobium hawassense]|uniref:Uncharacterized protein n=1 Tax=Mesorhizobium hawassense TaxID=1209954 RepID=A0A330HZK7_9HYPH|nr:hypothetical protein [Mesorhizobium hawassense]RAZ90167.1 hypothetical protein DPM33_15170 [Mesorhizobium hawassense]
MPIHQRAREAGIFNPSEVALLGRVFDKLKDEHQSPERREALASRLLANYLAGIRDEAELLSVSKLPLGR